MTERRVVRVLIGHADAVAVDGLRRTLAGASDEAIEVVGEASTGDEAARLAMSLRPDVLIIDLVMPGLGSIEAIRRVRAAGAVAGILALATSSGDAGAHEALQAGALRIVLKDTRSHDVLAAVRAAARGLPMWEPRAENARRHLLRERSPSPLDTLTASELAVLSLIVHGKNTKQIGSTLDLSMSAVKRRVSAILAKLSVTDRNAAAAVAVRHGLH